MTPTSSGLERCPSCLHSLDTAGYCATPSVYGCECSYCGGRPSTPEEPDDDEEEGWL